VCNEYYIIRSDIGIEGYQRNNNRQAEACGTVHEGGLDGKNCTGTNYPCFPVQGQISICLAKQYVRPHLEFTIQAWFAVAPGRQGGAGKGQEAGSVHGVQLPQQRVQGLAVGALAHNTGPNQTGFSC
jgi:hypothetical protein